MNKLSSMKLSYKNMLVKQYATSSHLSKVAILLLLSANFSTSFAAGEVWVNTSAFSDPGVNAKINKVEVTNSYVKVRKTRFTCKTSSGATASITKDGNINHGEYGTIRTSQCVKAKIEVKVSTKYKRFGITSWDKCSNWKSHNTDFVNLPNFINEFKVRGPVDGLIFKSLTCRDVIVSAQQ